MIQFPHSTELPKEASVGETARRPRRPTLRDALNAARSSGQKVKGAVVEPDGKITLTFDNGETATTTDDWDMHLKELDCGKS
jgi:hypothetical protein